MLMMDIKKTIIVETMMVLSRQQIIRLFSPPDPESADARIPGLEPDKPEQLAWQFLLLLLPKTQESPVQSVPVLAPATAPSPAAVPEPVPRSFSVSTT